MNFPKRATHPKSCRTCGGTGWMQVDDQPYIAGGHHGHYTMHAPCTQWWANDDPSQDADGYDTVDNLTLLEAITRFDQRARQGQDVTDILTGLYDLEHRTRP